VNVATLRDRVWNFLKDNGTHWPEADVVNYLNDAEVDIARRTLILRDRVSPISAANAVYTLPPTTIELFTVTYLGKVLPRVTEEEVSNFGGSGSGSDWTGTTTQVDAQVASHVYGPWGKLRFAVYLKKSGALVSDYLCEVARRPSAAMAVGGSPEIPEAYHEALIYYAVSSAYLKDFDLRNPDKAKAFMELYMGHLAVSA